MGYENQENHFDKTKQSAGARRILWSIPVIAAAVLCLIAGICFWRRPKKTETPAEIPTLTEKVYQSGSTVCYNSFRDIKESQKYAVDSENRLWVYIRSSETWSEAGILEEMEKPEEIWDWMEGNQQFHWAENRSLEKLKQENLRMYRVYKTPEVMDPYYLWHQQNGEILLGCVDLLPYSTIHPRFGWIVELQKSQELQTSQEKQESGMVWNLKMIFAKIADRGLTACWIIAAALLLRVLLSKAPKRIRGILWAFVAIRLVCPAFLESPWNLLPEKETAFDAGGPGNTDPITPPWDIGDTNKPEETQIAESVNGTQNISVSDNIGTMGVPDDAGSSAWDPGVWLSVIWLAGMTVMLIDTAVSILRLKGRLREAVCCGGRIWECDRIAAPFVFGFLRSRIYLPSSMQETDRIYVIAHEQAHIRRGDQIKKICGFALLSIYWFCPWIWLAYLLFCRDMEFACDERVIRTLGEASKKPYADSLIRLSASEKITAACPIAFAENNVRGRINNVLHYREPVFGVTLAAAVVCFAAGICFLCGSAWTPLDKNYKTDALVVSVGTLSSTTEKQIKEKQFSVDSQGRFWEYDGYFKEWSCVGSLEKAEMPQRIWEYLRAGQGLSWTDGYSFDKWKKDEFQVYRAAGYGARSDRLYYIWHRKNGEVFLTYGLTDFPVYGDFVPLVPQFQWMVQLKRNGKESKELKNTMRKETQYWVTESVYASTSRHAGSLGAQEAARHRYVIDEDWQLMDSGGNTQSSAWRSLGTLEERDAEEKENFWASLSENQPGDLWTNDYSPEKLKEENVTIYSVRSGQSDSADWYSYDLLYQKNGDILLVFGFPAKLPGPCWIRKLSVV